MRRIKRLAWLADASRKERANWQIEPGGYAVYWPDLDDGIEVVHALSLTRMDASKLPSSSTRQKSKNDVKPMKKMRGFLKGIDTKPQRADAGQGETRRLRPRVGNRQQRPTLEEVAGGDWVNEYTGNEVDPSGLGDLAGQNGEGINAIFEASFASYSRARGRSRFLGKCSDISRLAWNQSFSAVQHTITPRCINADSRRG